MVQLLTTAGHEPGCGPLHDDGLVGVDLTRGIQRGRAAHEHPTGRDRCCGLRPTPNEVSTHELRVEAPPHSYDEPSAGKERFAAFLTPGAFFTALFFTAVAFFTPATFFTLDTFLTP